MNPAHWKSLPPTPLQKVWNRLEAAANGWAKRNGLPETIGGTPEGHELAEAALAYARERWIEKTGEAGRRPSSGPKAQSGHVLPFGRSKGMPIEEAPVGDLKWARDQVAESIENPARQRFRAANERLYVAILRELASRGEA